mmetsp:Transcript_21094/g.58952  ORF Transcript_21094/g.58952 Transcript_21094/m.58952 type:complete len:147 (+) Transcript_21094:81-521(+)
MDWPPPGLEFNTKGYDKYHHMVQYVTDGQNKSVKICRCWQSKRFPYCDDTHKVLIEAGDNVGPFVAKINGGAQATNVAANTLTKRNQLPRAAAFFVAGFGSVGVACLALSAYGRGFRPRLEVDLPRGGMGSSPSPEHQESHNAAGD